MTFQPAPGAPSGGGQASALAPPDSDPRVTLLKGWLYTLAGWPALPRLLPESLAPASADASFRRYFRVHAEGAGPASLIIMDAPPQHEDCRHFIKVAGLLEQAGVNAPRILAQDLEQGFLLLSDLGGETFLSALRGQDPAVANRLYTDAAENLVKMQKISSAGVLPAYDEALLSREMQLFEDWYLARHLKTKLNDKQQQTLTKVKQALLANNLAQPAVFVHRDYHSRNLMLDGLLQDEDGDAKPGVLDFQDAVHGPITYDAVSLWRDAYIGWDEEQQIDWLIRYWSDAKRAGLPVNADFGAFYRDYEWMGLQRQLKVLGIFARLAYRDSKTGYLDDIPLVLTYARTAAARYQELAPLARIFDSLDAVPPPVGFSF
ncbi:MAG: phosphotransferase [Candidatus Protistobacter heckmanni]|nr:phosphotransferase [Candidatus Protistobacter heckmanni]